MSRGDTILTRTVTMRNPADDPIGAIEDIRRFLNAPVPPVGQLINAQVGTTYTFTWADFNALVTGANAGATTFTVPRFTTVPFPPGTHIDLIQVGAGKLTIAQDTGVTILSVASNKSLGAQYAAATLVASPTRNTWYLAGNLIA